MSVTNCSFSMFTPKPFKGSFFYLFLPFYCLWDSSTLTNISLMSVMSLWNIKDIKRKKWIFGRFASLSSHGMKLRLWLLC